MDNKKAWHKLDRFFARLTNPVIKLFEKSVLLTSVVIVALIASCTGYISNNTPPAPPDPMLSLIRLIQSDHLKDPTSFQLLEAYQDETEEASCITFLAKNSFGGNVKTRALARTTDSTNNKFFYAIENSDDNFDGKWEKVCENSSYHYLNKTSLYKKLSS